MTVTWGGDGMGWDGMGWRWDGMAMGWDGDGMGWRWRLLNLSTANPSLSFLKKVIGTIGTIGTRTIKHE